MNLKEVSKNSLKLLNNVNIVSDDIFRCLLENSVSVLSGGQELHANESLFGSEPDLMKELYANLLIAIVEFVRNGLNKEEVQQYLISECNINKKRSDVFADAYNNNKPEIQISLLNIGNHPPHITDVNWSIDFIVKSSTMDKFGGPLFRVSFTIETFNQEKQCVQMDHLNFTCNSQEMHDLVYKLKDAGRQCERIVMEH
ncbi:hypothetical protein WA026_002675 [Henosepilachna vigintioctopunctata]|uniref:COMM domain-containing protein 3 n=1 Tax=Henosepilachna vigintioctopunctata TaxID=420089 RepID=A0AAW1TU54_9CUCU